MPLHSAMTTSLSLASCAAASAFSVSSGIDAPANPRWPVIG
jgi:hypothetical protein